MNESTLYYYIGIIFALSFAYGIFMFVSNKKRANALLADYPDAARVKLKNVNWLIYTKTTELHGVDGEYPVSFTSGLSAGYYLTPGEHDLSVSFTKSRPGILHKRVTTTYAATNIHITAEPNKNYLLYFDTNTEQYVFEEVS